MSDLLRFSIKPARSAEDLEAIVCLFRAYAVSLGIDLSFQDFETEMAAMPGKYAYPGGELLLARNLEGMAVGCVGLRPIAPAGCCEMKRLYIVPAGRGLGIGKALVKAVVEVAGSLGYREIRLDTLPSMVEAISLYTNAGFAPITPYYDTPLAGTIFLSRALQSSDA
ncbi:acetyltransferase [Cryomyces antarcticus]